jgi:tetratricopeptide (TPR) repeat protein
MSRGSYNDGTMTTALSWRTLASIVVIAFAVKLVVLMQLWNHPLLQPHGELDTAYYVVLGRRIADEGVLAPIGAFFVSPLYVYFLAAVFALGGTLFTAQIVQIGLGSLGVGLLYATARHWFGHRAALVGASLAMLNGVFTFNEVLILQSALDPFLVSWALYALTRTQADGGTLASATAGASLALLALNRPNALVFAVAAVGALSVVQWRRRRVSSAAVLMTSLVAVLAANAARNYAVSGEAVLIASHGGLNFYIGNHERADGTYTPVPGITPSIAGQAGDSARVAEAATGRQLSDSAVSMYFFERALAWMTAHPADALRLTLRKAAILFNRIDVPLNYSYGFYAREPSSFLRVLAVGPWLLIPLGLVGLFWPSLRVNRSGYWIWATFVPVYGAAVVAFFVTDRYRMPMFVPLCATAAAALLRFFDLLRARRVGPLARPAAAVAMFALVAFANLRLDSGVGGEQARKVVWLIEQGSFDEARAYFEQISREHSHPGVLRFRVGRALLDAGRPAEATPLLAQAVTIDGPQPALQLALGESLLRSGRYSESVPHLQAAYNSAHDRGRAGPMFVRALVHAGRPDDAIRQLSAMPLSVAQGDAAGEIALDFGTLALERNAAGEATRWLDVAVKQAPDRAEAQEKLGLAIFLGGDPKKALQHLERARQLDSASASARLNLAVVYAELGMFAAARGLANEALRLDPGEPRAAALLKALPR